MTAVARITNNPSGRPSNAVLQERIARAREVNSLLRIENRALKGELADLATEIAALSSRTVMAIHAERPDVALHVAGRLDALAASLTRRGAA